VLRFDIHERETLKLLYHAFSDGPFTTVTISWRRKGIQIIGFHPSTSFIGRLELQEKSFDQYTYEDEGSLAVFTKHLRSALDFAFSPRHAGVPIATSWYCSKTGLKIIITVEGVATLTRNLRDVPDSILPPQTGPSFTAAAELKSSDVNLIREIFDAFATVEQVRLRVESGKFTATDPKSLETKFQPLGVNGKGDAETLISRGLIEYSSAVILHCNPPESLALTVINDGFAKVEYTFAKGRLTYLIAGTIEGE